jgi:uncharacterized RDD family membrane protein YckC
MQGIYLIENGQKAGPFTLWQLREKVRGGDVTRNTLAWEPGMENWSPAGEIGSVRFEFERAEADSGDTDPVKVEKSATAPPVINPTDTALTDGATAPSRNAKDTAALPAPRPWRRFWARIIDMGFVNLSAIVIGVASGALTPTEAYQPSIGFILTLPIAWIFLESSLLMILGTTPGKYLLGIRIQTTDGARQLTLRQALGRSFMVWWRGYGLGLTIPMVLTCTFSHFVLKTTRTTPWDMTYGTQVSYGDIKPWRIILLTFLFLGLFQLLYSLAGMPPKMF